VRAGAGEERHATAGVAEMIFRVQGTNTLRVHLRFVRYLLREFRWPLGVLATLVLGGGLVLHLCYHREYVSYPRACYSVFLLIFLESGLDFPDEWYLQPFFFLLPIIGLGAVADSVVRLAYLIFTQKQQLPEWQRMVASLYRNHVVVVGVGKVGYQIIKGLLELRETVVAIDLADRSTLREEAFDLGVPIIQGNARNAKVLEQAGVRVAAAVIMATSDDLTNLDGGLTARDLNPKARIVLRLFDESLAVKVAGAFTLPAISTAQVAAPAFIAAATGRKVYQEFRLSDRPLHLTDLTIHDGGQLVGMTVGVVQSDNRVNIVMHEGSSGVNVNPGHETVLRPGDSLLVIAPIDRLLALEGRNQPEDAPPRAPQTITVVPASQRRSSPDVTPA
jgi:voltage-gated potassium channel